MWTDDVAAAAHTTLLTDPWAEPGRQLLRARGVPEADWVRYQIGFATVNTAMPAVTPPFIEFAKRHWWGRLVFPLTTPLGGVGGFQTRATDTKDYRLFYAMPGDVVPALFGCAQALPVVWDTGQVAITEGVFDALAVHRAGIDNVVAVITAKVPIYARRFLARYARRVTVLLDMDEPGREGAQRLLDIGPQIVLPHYPAHDPDEWSRAPGGLVAMQRFLRGLDERIT